MQAMVACLAQWRDSILGCDDAGLRDQVREIESVSRMLHSVMLEAVAELESRAIAASAGFRTTKRLLAGMLHLSATEAGTRVALAAQLAPRRTLNGELLAPQLPHTAAALAAGEIGPAQIRVIAETMNAIPTSVSPTQREAAEAELARHARSFDPTSLHKIGRHILAHLDPDGPKPREEPEPAPTAGELRFRERRRPAGGLRARPRRPRLPYHRRGTSTPHRHPHLGHPAHRSRGRDPGLRNAPQRSRRPTVGMRRENNPRGPGWGIRNTRRRTSHADRPAIHSPRARRAGSRMRFPRLRPATGNVPGPPLSTLG